MLHSGLAMLRSSTFKNIRYTSGAYFAFLILVQLRATGVTFKGNQMKITCYICNNAPPITCYMINSVARFPPSKSQSNKTNKSDRPLTRSCGKGGTRSGPGDRRQEGSDGKGPPMLGGDGRTP